MVSGCVVQGSGTRDFAGSLRRFRGSFRGVSLVECGPSGEFKLQSAIWQLRQFAERQVRQVSVPQLGCVAFIAGHLALRRGRDRGFTFWLNSPVTDMDDDWLSCTYYVQHAARNLVVVVRLSAFSHHFPSFCSL